jgi:hypothetical protein
MEQEHAPTPPSSPPGIPPAGEPAAPPTPAPAPAPAPAQDPYAGLNYEALREQHGISGMTAGELAQVFPAAHEVVSELVPGLRAVLDQVEAAGMPLGNSPGMLRSLASYGEAYRGLKRDEQHLTAEIHALATELGVPVPAAPKVAPLQVGQGLRQAVSRMLRAHIADTATEGLIRELRKDSAFESQLARLAQEVHTRRQRVEALAAQREELRARLEQPETLRMVEGRRVRNADLSIEYEQTRREWREAERAGHISLAAALKDKLAALQRRRLGGDYGGDAA